MHGSGRQSGLRAPAPTCHSPASASQRCQPACLDQRERCSVPLAPPFINTTPLPIAAKPGILDPKGRKKWEAWTNKKGLSKEDAMTQYIAYVKATVAKYAKPQAAPA